MGPHPYQKRGVTKRGEGEREKAVDRLGRIFKRKRVLIKGRGRLGKLTFTIWSIRKKGPLKKTDDFLQSRSEMTKTQF